MSNHLPEPARGIPASSQLQGRQPLMGRDSVFEHGMKNYLAIIVGYTDLLIEDPTLDDSRRDDIMEIRKAAEAALALLTGDAGPR